MISPSLERRRSHVGRGRDGSWDGARRGRGKVTRPELSTGRMDPRVGSGRVGSGRVGSGHDFAGFWRVGSGRVSTSDFLVLY